jgi:neutral ceramidase
MSRGTRGGLLALVAFAAALVLAAPALAVRSPKGAGPSVRVLTKDQRTALKTRKLSLRVSVRRAPARIRLRGLGLNLGRRPMRIVAERTIRFRSPHSRVINLKLTREALGLLAASRAACRDVRVSAFASGRLTGRHDDRRTTLVRHSRTLRHAGTNCGRPGGASGGSGAGGGADSPTLPPGFGNGPSGTGEGPSGGAPGSGPDPVIVPEEPITMKAGAANADITPPVGTPMFAYTARSNIFDPPTSQDAFMQVIADSDPDLYAKTFEPSTGIHARVRARAIVIENAGKKFALVQADLGGLPYSMTQEVLKRVAQTGITGDRLLLSATHTHSSSGAIWSVDNLGYGFVGGDAYDPRVFDEVASGISKAIIDANARLTPARIGVGTAELRGASHNRDHDPFKLNTDAPADEKANGDLAIDPRVTVIRVDDADGRPLGAWSNFAVHPTAFGDGNSLFSGDHPSTTERIVEQAIAVDAAARGAAPQTPPVEAWTNANEGDISPNGSSPKDSTETDGAHQNLNVSANSYTEANLAGVKVAEGVFAAWRDAGTAMHGSLPMDTRRTFFTFDGETSEGEPVGPNPVLGAGGITQDDGFCAPVDNFAGPGQGKKFPTLIAPGAAPDIYPVSLTRFGPLAIIALPSEVTKQMGKRIRDSVQTVAGANAPEGTILAGLTNAYNSYTATPEEYDACHYEGSFTLWGRRQGSRYRDYMTAMANALYKNGELPLSAPEPPQASPGVPNQPSPRTTPNAGSIVTQPSDATRLNQVTIKWNGGDASVDAPRGKDFVTLERQSGNDFLPVATEDSVFDITQYDKDTKIWTHTFEFHECVPVGAYRFVIRGRADKGSGVADYKLTSRNFEVRRSTGIRAYSKKVADGVARVRAEYTGFAATPLTGLSRRVRSGFAILRVKGTGGAANDVIAPIDSKGLEFTATVPAGATVDVVSIEDACGNTGS